MHNFKKAAVSSLAFLLFVVLISSVIISGHTKLDTYFYQDAKVRKELAGTIDYIITGSSHGLTGFVPSIIDEELGCTSYNLCGTQMTGHGRIALLQTELERNPVKTVVAEVSFNTLSRNYSTEHFEGDMYLLSRLESFSDKAELFFKHAEFEDYPLIYSSLIEKGITSYAAALFGQKDEQLKGFLPRAHEDVVIPTEYVANDYQRNTVYAPIREENINLIYELAELCKSYDAELIFAVVPVSDRNIWINADHDAAMQWFVDFCAENNYRYYNFNLLKNRGEFLSDAESYSDSPHLNGVGAEAFTKEYCRIMKLAAEGEDLSDLFYESYQEALLHSPYAELVSASDIG